jgi:hypothetical protein
MEVSFYFSHDVRLSPLGTAAIVWPIVPASDARWWCLWSSWWNEEWRNPAPVPLCPPQTPNDPTRARTRAAVVGSRRLTVWATTRPTIEVKTNKNKDTLALIVCQHDAVLLECLEIRFKKFCKYIVTCLSVTTDGFGLVTGFTDHLHIAIPSNYGAIANLHNLQITTAHAKSYQLLLVVSW